MQYLNSNLLETFDDQSFRATRPYPWTNPHGMIQDDAFRRLREQLPDPSLFKEEFGVKRSHGQQPHDRLTLEYNTELEIAPEWHDFVGELRGSIYQDFLKRAFGRGMLALTFHWHYTPRSCSVSPHCDALRKLGSHIFYFNTDEDWDESWGGQTIVLDDGGRFSRKSAPGFDQFEETGRSRIINNRSFLFARNANSWHGVEELNCPEGAYRKVFIVVIEDKARSMLHTAYDALSGRKRSRY